MTQLCLGEHDATDETTETDLGMASCDCGYCGQVQIVRRMVHVPAYGWVERSTTATCPRCKVETKAQRIVVTPSDAPCDRRCTRATGTACGCSCGGRNHGAEW